jgi:hypothetical protein
MAPDNATSDTRSGKYVALANLSIGRAGNKERQADIVHAGETVTLTDEEAESLSTRHRVPVIRKAGEADFSRPLTARDLFNTQPGASSFGAAPDPAGSTRVTQTGVPDPALSPEATGPSPQVEGSRAKGTR